MSGYVCTKNANKNGPFSCKSGKWAGERGQQEAFAAYMSVFWKKNIPVRRNRRRKALGNPVFRGKRLPAIGIYTKSGQKHWRFRVKPASLGQGAAASARALPPRSGRCRCPAPAAFLPLSSPPASNKKPRAMAYVPVNRGPRFSLPYPRRRLLPGFWRRYTVTPLDKSASRRAPKYRSYSACRSDCSACA